MRRDGMARRRDRQIDATASHVASHLLRALDCLAAAFLIIGAVPRPVRRADWSQVEKLAGQCQNASTTEVLEPPTTPGRELQDRLFAHVLTSPEHGPTDWLPWLNATRNSRIHRGARTSWYLLYGPRRRPEGVIRPFPAHPDLTDVELMSRVPQDNSQDGMSALRLVRRSDAVLDGCLDSTIAFVASLGQGLDDCWAARRANPSLLIQRGAQWQDLERVVELNFPGYGSEPELIGNQMHLSPDHTRRLESAHVMDSQRHRWRD